MNYAEELSIINTFRRSAPVDVQALSLALGVPVRSSFLGPNLSGLIERTGDAKFAITVNASHPETRQRFTMAHELGHYMLHRHLLGSGVDDNRMYRSEPGGPFHNTKIGPAQETEANKFAAELLMPHELIALVRKRGVTTARDLAREFGVSEHAMSIRIGVTYAA